MPYNQLIFTQRKKKIIGICCILLISIYFSVLAILANWDLSIGRHVLFMDEHVTFDGVRHLLHPESRDNFLFNLLDGKDHRYGRILWNISALFSFLPERIFGAQGQIIATRLTQFSALITAYLIFSITLLSSWKFRIAALLLLLSLPSTSYYANMPKPEPLQLLFLSLFLWKGKKCAFGFGAYWIFLGLAFGAKISVLPIIPLFIILAGALFFEQYREKDAWKKPFIALGSLLAGFLIGEPLNLLSFFQLSLAPTDNYIFQTFRSTGHGADDLNVSWRSWFQFILEKFTTIPKTMLVITAIGIAVLFVCFLRNTVRDYLRLRADKMERPLHQIFSDNQGLILGCAGLMLFAPIVFTVKRVWGFYLHNSFVLMGLATLVMAETTFLQETKSKSVMVVQRAVTWVVALLLVLQAVLFLTPKSTLDFITLSKRTQSADFKRQIAEHEYLTSLLKITAVTIGRPIVFYLDPMVFQVESTSLYKGNLFWGPFLRWGAGADMVVLYKDHTVEGTLPDRSNSVYEKLLLEKWLFRQHVAADVAGCISDPCYVRLETSGNTFENLRIFVRSDIFQLLVPPKQH